VKLGTLIILWVVVGLGISIIVILNEATTTITLDFNDFFLPADTYSEDGFVLLTDVQFNVDKTAGNPSPAMFPASTGQTNFLFRENVEKFNLISMDIRGHPAYSGNSTSIEFSAVRTIGVEVVSVKFTFDSHEDWKTYVFTGFTDIATLSWDFWEPEFVGAWDNIVLEVDFEYAN